MNFVATAEHYHGETVAHPCLRGVYGDPTDGWRITVAAATLLAAFISAREHLGRIVGKFPPCECHRARAPGSETWWASVEISLWPQDAKAYAAWIAEGFDPDHDPYGLIPTELKRTGSAGERRMT